MTIPDVPDPNTDLADIRQHWLAFCSHDIPGLPLPFICPTEDHRPVIAALVGEVETLRAEVARLEAADSPNGAAVSGDDTGHADLRERLAAIEHERWADWQRYVHDQATPLNGSGGARVIPAVLVERWERQIATSYADLSEAEKQSDRDQVDRYWPLVADLLADATQLTTERDEAIRVAAERVLEARQAEAERDEAQQTLMEANATIVRAMEALGVDHPVWLILDDYDGSMDNVTALVTERDEAQALLRLAPHHQQQVETLEYELVQARAEGLWHVGRSWEGTPVENSCPCPKEPCGLIDLARSVAECLEHPVTRGKSLRQSHRAKDCPGVMRNA